MHIYIYIVDDVPLNENDSRIRHFSFRPLRARVSFDHRWQNNRALVPNCVWRANYYYLVFAYHFSQDFTTASSRPPFSLGSPRGPVFSHATFSIRCTIFDRNYPRYPSTLFFRAVRKAISYRSEALFRSVAVTNDATFGNGCVFFFLCRGYWIRIIDRGKFSKQNPGQWRAHVGAPTVFTQHLSSNRGSNASTAAKKLLRERVFLSFDLIDEKKNVD